MGVSDELRDSFGQEFFNRRSERVAYHNWTTVCVCGHIAKFHSETIGGEYQVPEMRTQRIGGEDVTVTTTFDGCTGAMPGRGFQNETQTINREALTIMVVVNPTCPCTEFREVAKLDRPNRYFNQRLPVDRKDHQRHPLVVGLRAFSTHLSRRRAALSDPAWASAELDRRFIWIEGKRVCAISRCNTTDDVWPVFIDGELSELRCSKHR